MEDVTDQFQEYYLLFEPFDVADMLYELEDSSLDWYDRGLDMTLDPKYTEQLVSELDGIWAHWSRGHPDTDGSSYVGDSSWWCHVFIPQLRADEFELRKTPFLRDITDHMPK